MNTGKYTRALEEHRKKEHAWNVIFGTIRIASTSQIVPQLMCDDCRKIISITDQNTPANAPREGTSGASEKQPEPSEKEE